MTVEIQLEASSELLFTKKCRNKVWPNGWSFLHLMNITVRPISSKSETAFNLLRLSPSTVT